MKRAPQSENHTQLEVLVERAIRGDSKALHSMCEKIVGSVLYQVSCLLGSESDSEDVAQEVMFKVCKNIHSLREPKTFKKWLSTIIVNEKNVYLRKKQKRGIVVDVDDYLEQLLESRVEHVPILNFESAELRKEIKDLIDNLPDRQREAIMLRYYSDLSLAEIAEVMDTTRQNASQHVRLASQKIKRQLGEHPTAVEKNLLVLGLSGTVPVGEMLADVLSQNEITYRLANEAVTQNILADCSRHILTETASVTTATTAGGISNAAVAYACVGVLTIAAAAGVYFGGILPENQPQPLPASIVFYGGTDYGVEFARVNPERIYMSTEEMEVQHWWITPIDSDEVLMGGDESTIDNALTRLRESGASGEFLIHFRLYSESWGHTVYQNFYILPGNQPDTG